MSSQALYDSLWERSIQKFPQLAAQFGQAPPRDAKGRPLLDAMTALRTLQAQAPAPQQPAPVAPAPAPQQLVPTQQPAGAPQQDLSGLSEPSYWDPGEWARRGKQIAEGVVAFDPMSPWGMYKSLKGAQEATELSLIHI